MSSDLMRYFFMDDVAQGEPQVNIPYRRGYPKEAPIRKEQDYPDSVRLGRFDKPAAKPAKKSKFDFSKYMVSKVYSRS